MSKWKPLYNTAAWATLRKGQLLKQPLCRLCLLRGRVIPATVVDHVIPHRGDPHLFYHGELQSLCKLCHDGTKQAEENGKGLRGGDAAGYPTDPNHHWG